MPQITQVKVDPNNEDLDFIVSSWTYNPTKERIKERISRHLSEGKLFSMVYQNQLIGAVAYKEIDQNVSEITGIGISVKHRNQGFGRQLINIIEQEIPTKEILIETDNNAVNFYEHCEYKIYNTKTLDNGIIRYQLIKKKI
ncbi:GNAT family N-acetyltransferase [Spirochaeta isovalerica]|uniref:Ribosomal protein S18 acetylase RimI-like enzyme n=1 Tax=Spirochaeta isovalerica TaxID=150 RepID=A0A841RH43_9SPIO|nr:GNAT family N-acetyltransferase [Spirochaeta isovalerica]MBB6482691.1 ribosomal protein S18 acetylase RimI-like enzyme [Spirochaeta isovalerica]